MRNDPTKKGRTTPKDKPSMRERQDNMQPYDDLDVMLSILQALKIIGRAHLLAGLYVPGTLPFSQRREVGAILDYLAEFASKVDADIAAIQGLHEHGN